MIPKHRVQYQISMKNVLNLVKLYPQDTIDSSTVKSSTYMVIEYDNTPENNCI